MESEQVTPVDSIKVTVRSSVKVPEFDKHLMKARGHIGRNIVEIKMKTIVWKPLMIKITKLHLRNLDKSTLILKSHFSYNFLTCECMASEVIHFSYYIMSVWYGIHFDRRLKTIFLERFQTWLWFVFVIHFTNS